MKKLTTNEFINKSNLKHNFKYDYSRSFYVNRRTKIDIICHLHGVFNQQAESHIKGNGCPKCSNVHRMNTNEFIEKANFIHKNKYNYSLTEYTLSKEKVKIICPKHGIFIQKAGDHLVGKGCFLCSESKGEIKIKELLSKKNITFIPQYKFKECKNIRLLPFDFYLPDYNICIEYQGRHHYEPVLAFGGLVEHEKTILRDKIKEEFCKSNGIKLIKIKYNQEININFI